MEKIWLKEYPEGIPAEINPELYPSIKAIFEESCQKFADKPAFSNLGHTYTFKELESHAQAFAAYCQNELKLEKGDRLAIMMPNLLQYPIALFGALIAGLTVVNVNPLYTTRELEYQLNDSGAKAIVILENFAKTLQDCITSIPTKHVITTKIGDLFPFPKSVIINLVVKYVKKMVPGWHIDGTIDFKEVMKKGSSMTYHQVEVTPQDIAFLQYTGGTTGRSKGAMLTHRNMVANITQASAWLEPFLSEGHETIITALPLYHIFSLTANCLTFMRYGAMNVLITNPKDIPNFVKALKAQPFTAITGVNTLFNALLNNPDFKDIDFSPLKIALGGGMAVQHAVAVKWQQVTQSPLLEAYGLTETSPAACINPLNLKEYNGSIGLPIPSTEVKIMKDDGTEAPLGEEGELCIRGPQVMKGYWEKPEETAKCLSEDGWLKTGDIGRVDEKGFVYIVDRKKDMILVSGFNVYPNEIEDVVAEHPGVLEVAAIGVPDTHSGEAIKLFVVKKSDELSEQEILQHCRTNLTGYKIPKHIAFREELPKTNVGKILRRELRESA